MTKTELMQLSQGMSELYTGLETDLMANIAEYLKSGNVNCSTAQWKMQMLAQLGALDKKNIAVISKYAGIAPDILTEVLETASLTAIQELEPGYQQLAADGIINGANVPVEDTMSRALKNYNKQAQRSLNMVNTVMLYKSKSAVQKIINNTAEIADKQDFLNILNKSAGKVVTGAESRQAAMRQCINEMSQKGIPAFVDKRGREWSPEAYINMNIRTTCNNVAHKSQLDRMNDYGIDLVEVSSHSGARPKCAKDQGKIFNRSGSDGYTTDLYGNKIRYYAWSDSSYGEPDGLLGINCGHHIYPFVAGISVHRYFPYDEKENSEQYQKIQGQRELERRVRKSKRECMMLDTTGDAEGLKKASVNLKNQQQTLKQYCADNDLSYKSDRTAVVGYNKAVAGKVRKSLTSASKGGTIKKKPYEIKKSRKRKLEIIEKGASIDKPIFAVDTETNKFASYVMNIPKNEGFYDVALHGTPTSAEFFGEEIDAYTLANIIRNRKDYESGKKIRLLSCSTGKTDETGDCFAQILANELGVEVEAPTKDILVFPNGDFIVGEENDGIMKTFFSRGRDI